MSTDYKMVCRKCRTSGGMLSVQMWGAGNFNIVATFKYVMHHALNCGAESIGMAIEQTPEYDWPEQTDDPAFMEETAGIFPRSDDWAFMMKHERNFVATWLEQWKADRDR